MVDTSQKVTHLNAFKVLRQNKQPITYLGYKISVKSTTILSRVGLIYITRYCC